MLRKKITLDIHNQNIIKLNIFYLMMLLSGLSQLKISLLIIDLLFLVTL